MEFIKDISNKYAIFGNGEIKSAYLFKDDKYYYERVETKDGKIKITKYELEELPPQ
jgi:hypothetical protein